MTAGFENLLRTALVYDFDGTLAPGNIQEHSLLTKYMKTPPPDFSASVRYRARGGSP